MEKSMHNNVKRNFKIVAGLAALGSTCLVDYSYAAAQTFLGTSERNPRGGSVQVQITVDNGKITAITTPVQPGGGNQWYSNYAIPTLTKLALSAQSANISINAVSGASQVATAWKASLAAAISKAGSAITGGSGTPATSAPVPVQTQSTQQAPSGNNFPQRPPRGEERHGFFGFGGHDEEEGREHEGGEDDDDNRGVITPRTAPTPRATVAPKTTPAPATTPAPTTTPKALSNLTLKNDFGLVPKAGVIQKTITCVKGTLKKTVKGTNPKCPTGYTLKKV